MPTDAVVDVVVDVEVGMEEESVEFNWKCSRPAGSLVLAVESGERGGEEDVWESARRWCCCCCWDGRWW